VTDGERIYAFFGSRGLYCLDFDGNIIWERNFGQMKITMDFGEGASPTVYADRVIMVWDEEGQSFITALDKQTGKEIWRVDRDEVTSWSTPRVIEVNGRAQVITSATSRIRSYDFETGELIWECAGMTRNVIPSPVYANGIVYLMSGYRGNALVAIDLARAKGNITDTDVILWKYDQFAPYTPSPVLMDGKLYFLRANNPELSCLDALDGKIHYSMQKIQGFVNIYSSPTGVADRLYLASEGTVVVVKSGPEFGILATNKLDDNFHASPVIIGNELYLRGFRYLYCLAE
jgi:outer membrane protein assembly factor BamB